MGFKKNTRPFIRALSCFLLCIALLPVHLQGQSLKVYHLDVGQGDATFILARDNAGNISKTVLIDGGLQAYGPMIVNYIKNTLGINRIDYVIASHYDNDHVGGLAYVLNYAHNNPGSLTVDSVMDRGDLLYPHPNKGQNYKAAAQNFNHRTLTPGYVIKLFDDLVNGTHTGKYTIAMTCFCVNGSIYLSPTGTYNAVALIANPDENDLSTGFLITYGKFSYLTCGDIGGKRGSQGGTCGGPYGCNFANLETQLITRTGSVSAYKVNHHGSRCSSNDTWVTASQARVAIISSGKNGRYKHPRPEVVNALNADSNLVNFYMTASTNFYSVVLAPKGKLNPVAGQPVILEVRQVLNNVDITVASKFIVAGITY